MSSITIVIPAHNEGRRLPSTLTRLKQYIEEQDDHRPIDVLVVANGCTDHTVDVARRFGVRVINLYKAGKGHAIRQGMLAARGEWRYMCDADLSTPIHWLDRLCDHNADIVIASREGPGAVRYRETWQRHLSGRVFNLLIRAVTGLPYQDTQCGFKLFSAHAAKDIFSRCTVNGFAIDVEALYLANKLGYSVAEVGVDWYNDPHTTVHLVRDSWRMLQDVIKIRETHDNSERKSLQTKVW